MPDATPVITGHGGAVSIGATLLGLAAINGKLRRWSLRLTGATVKSRGAGVPWQLAAAIDADWEFTSEVEFEDTTTLDANISLLGDDTYISAKRDADDAQAVLELVGVLQTVEVEVPSEDAVTGTITVVCSKGIAPTIQDPA